MKDDTYKYFTMNFKHEIDPKTFTTEWVNKKRKDSAPKASKNKTIIERSVIRVKLRSEKNPDKLTRPTRVYRFDEVADKGKETEEIINTIYRKYSIEGKYGKVIDISDIVFLGSEEWPTAGPSPTPRPSKKYTKEQLKKFGYDDEILRKIYRGYSAKDVSALRKVCGLKNMSADQARAALEKHGSLHKAKESNFELIQKTKETREKAQENVQNLGRYTYKKRKINYKPNSRRGRKMAKNGMPRFREDIPVNSGTKKPSNKKKASISRKRAAKRSLGGRR